MIRSASRDAISLQVEATAVFRATSNAGRPPPAGTPIAMPTPISTPAPSCGPTAAAKPEGGSDAHPGFGDPSDRDGLSSRAGGGPNIRPRLSGLSARVRTGHLLRMPLFVASAVQRVGYRTRGTMRHQSVFRERGRAEGATLRAAPQRLLS